MTVPQTIQQFLKHPDHLLKNIIWRFPKSQSEQRHIFVIGAPRSGTTLVKLLLGAHPDLTGPGYETALFMYKDLFAFSYPGFTTLEIEQIQQDSQDIVQFFDKFAELNLRKYGGKRFIEKTPPHVLRLPFLSRYFPQAQFINIFRDGRDCYCSARRHPNVVQGSHVQRYARYWKRCIEARLRQGNQENILDVQYEDLAQDPSKIVQQIMAFLKEEYDPRQISPDNYSKNQITKTNRQEFSKLSQAIDTSSVKRYQKELSTQEIEQFHQIAGHQLEQLGYEV